MTFTPQDILDNLLAALRNNGAFAAVALGSAGNDLAVPRAELAFEELQTRPHENWPHLRWHRLAARLFIITRSNHPAEAQARLQQLALAATDALLDDPTRNSRCCDLPLGPATEVRQTQLPRDQRHPQRQSALTPATPTQEISLLIHCHYETENPAGFLTAARLDEQDLFSTGPCTFTPGPWQHQTLHHTVPGLDGQIVLDLGRRSRLLRQHGQLSAENNADLQNQLAAIEAFQDGQLHTLTDHDGNTYPNVHLETFEPGPTLRRGPVLRCNYTLSWREIA